MKIKKFVKSFLRTVIATALLLWGASSSHAQNVKITPLGTHTGELCDRDRATLFEDPTGVRLLYDVGQSTMGVLSRVRQPASSSSLPMGLRLTCPATPACTRR